MKNFVSELLFVFRSKMSFAKSQKINFAVFPFVWAVTWALSITEIFTYPGFVAKHLILSLDIFIFITVVSGLGILLSNRVKNISRRWQNNYETLVTINNLAFFPLLVVGGLILLIEFDNYHNYVFYNFHINPDNVLLPCYLSGFVVFMGLIENFINNNLKTISLLGKSAVFLGLIIWILTANISEAGKSSSKGFYYLMRNPIRSYDQKMEKQLGVVYRILQFIKKNTPEDAVIMIPPQLTPYYTEGNWAYVRYFLYPRVSIPAQEIESPVDYKADYVMIAWGSWSEESPEKNGWPKVKIPAEWIIYMNGNNGEILKRMENTIYDPLDPINDHGWGLIKLKKT